MLDHTTIQKKEYTPQMIKEELRSNVAFSEAEKVQDKEEKKKKLDEERKKYIERVMGESLESNATLIKKMEEQELQAREKGGKKSVKASGKNKIKAAIPEKSSFVQKLPRVKNSRKFWQVWKRDEDDDVNELKKTFKSADLCTLRESDSMRKYLQNGGYKEAALEKVNEDERKGSYLKLVDEVLKFKLTVNMFTDDYLSENIVKLYDYEKKLEEAAGYRHLYTNLFTGLPYDKRLEFAERCELDGELKRVLDSHMLRHGIKIVDNKVMYRRETANKTERNNKNAELDKQYAAIRENFLLQLEYGQVINQAEALTKLARTMEGNGFSSESILSPLDELISSKPQAFNAYGAEIKLAYGEIQKALSVRDGAIEQMRELLPLYHGAKGMEKEHRKKEIKVLVDRCKNSASHVDHYRNTIRFIMGDISELSQDTMSFLKKNKMDELTDLVNLRIMGDCLEEARGLYRMENDSLGFYENQISNYLRFQQQLGEMVESPEKFKSAYRELNLAARKKGQEAEEARDLRIYLQIRGITPRDFEKAKSCLEDINGKIQELTAKADELQKKYPTKKMSDEKFFSLSERYHKIRTPILNGVKRRTEAEKHIKEGFLPQMRAYANEYKLPYSENSLGNKLYDPIQSGTDIKWDWFYKAITIMPREGSKNDADLKVMKELSEEGLLPVFNRIVQLDSDSIDTLSFKQGTSLAKQETWDNYNLLRVGQYVGIFKGALRRFGIVPTQEQDAKLIAFASVAKKMIKRYDTMLSSERSPMEVLYEQQDISAEYEGILNKVADVDEGKTFLSVASRDWKDKYNRLGKRGSLPYKDALGSGMRQYWELANCWKETDHSFAEEFDKEYRMQLGSEAYEKEKQEKDAKENKSEDINKTESESSIEENKTEEKKIAEDKIEEKEEKSEEEKKEEEKKEEKSEEDKKEEKSEEEKTEEKKRDEEHREEEKKEDEKKSEGREDEKKEEVKIIIQADSPEVLKLKADEQKEYKYSDYTEQQRINYQKLLKEKGFEVPRSKEKVAEMRSRYTVRKGWYEEDESGNKVLKENYFWREDADPVLKEAYDWLMGYYRSRDKGVVKAGKLKKQDMPDYHLKIKGPEKWYEKQIKGSNNCWCCAGTAMYNQFVGKKELKQTDLREFEPDYKDSREVTELDLDIKEFDRHLAMTQSYAGKDAIGVGNIFEMGDFFLEKNRNIMINRMTFNTPALLSGNKTKEQLENEETLYHNQKAAFLKTVYEVLKSGNIVGLLSTWQESGHYITIVGIDGQKLDILDSANGVETQKTVNVDMLLQRKLKGDTIEITYLSKMKAKEELLKEFSNLTYDEKKGYDVQEVQTESAFNVAQTKGICVSKYPSEMPEGMEGIGLSVYFSKEAVK